MSNTPPWHPYPVPKNDLVPAFHSESAYSISSGTEDEIVRVTTYRPKSLDEAYVWFPPDKDRVISSNIGQAAHPLGDLDRLPLELLDDICLQLDIESLFNLRHTNRRAREVVNSIRQFRLAATHAPHPLRALLEFSLAARVTLMQFYEMLCAKECFICSQFGDVVCIPLWRRCCPRCVDRDDLFAIVSLDSAKRALKLPGDSLPHLPIFKTIPGTYTAKRKQRNRRISLVPLHSTIDVSQVWNTRLRHDWIRSSQLNVDKVFTYMACCVMTSYDTKLQQAEKGIYCAGCCWELSDAERRTFIGEPSWKYETRQTMYNRDNYLEHFKRCRRAQILWEESENGTVTPPSYPKPVLRINP